jgi:hypothetical protein
MENFDPKTDKIAVVIREFTLKRKSEIFFDRYSEPYIISMAIDEGGSKKPSLNFNMLPFPNVKKGDKITFDGQGHLIYGPDNPGQFLAYTILFMESDKDVRNFGKLVEDTIQSEAANIGAKALLAAAPTYSTAITVLQKLVEFMAVKLQRNRDDELYRRSGTLLRDVRPPYDILRTYESANDYIHTKNSVIPLKSSNMLGSQTRKLDL